MGSGSGVATILRASLVVEQGLHVNTSRVVNMLLQQQLSCLLSIHVSYHKLSIWYFNCKACFFSEMSKLLHCLVISLLTPSKMVSFDWLPPR